MKKLLLLLSILILNSNIAQAANNLISADWWKKATLEDVKREIANGADVNAKDNGNFSVLMIASLNNENPEIIKILINAGADVNFKFNDDTGNIYNALLGAAYHNKNPEVIKVLINAGAKDNADAYRKTAAFYAMIRNPNHKIFEILVEDRIDYFCQINNKISSEVYYCKDRLTSYMQKENRLPSCVNNVSAMLALTPYIGLSKATINDGVYDIVVMGNIASQFNCSLSATFNDM